MAGTGTWLMNGYDLGLPLEIDFGVSADIGSVRINGAKTQSEANSVEATSFKVKFFKEFSDEVTELEFRQQMEQFQNGINFMPYYLETNQHAQEFHEGLVNIKSVDMPREGGKVGHMQYEVEFALLGHASEFVGYTQFRPVLVNSNWSGWDSNRRVDLYYPANAQFHSDPPQGATLTELGRVEYRNDPSRNAISYEGAMGIERVGIEAKQGNVQLYSPYFNIGAGFSVSNGNFKIVWDENGNPDYFMWHDNKWNNYHTKTPDFTWHGYDRGSSGNVTNEVTYLSKEAARRKLQLKRISPEYIEVEQEYQHSDGAITAIQWFMGRGKNYVQIRARILNRKMDWFTTSHYVKRDMLESYTLNSATQLITDTTNAVADLTEPLIYVTLNKYSVNGGSIGYVNPDKLVRGDIITNMNGGYVQLLTRHSWNMEANVWSEPILYFQGTTSTSARQKSAGYVIKADSQVIHRSHVY
jgi:hypothetical protein